MELGLQLLSNSPEYSYVKGYSDPLPSKIKILVPQKWLWFAHTLWLPYPLATGTFINKIAWETKRTLII